MQAPGGPKEDTSGGFTEGGWFFHYWDKIMGDVMTKMMAVPFELLLGRVTYDIFASHWPNTKNDQVVAKKFNSTRKYVVTRQPRELSWNNSVLITGDVVSKIKSLKKTNDPDLWVHGSGNLIQTLLANSLIDTMYIWTFPVTVGNGKRLFSDGTKPREFQLVDCKISSSGVTIATYIPSGKLKTGSFAD